MLRRLDIYVGNGPLTSSAAASAKRTVANVHIQPPQHIILPARHYYFACAYNQLKMCVNSAIMQNREELSNNTGVA